MKKKIQKPFDLKAWENGAKVETRDGRQVRIFCTDVKNDCKIVGVIIQNSTYEVIRKWYEDGHYFSTKDDDDDLVIVEEIEEPKRWADNKEAVGDGWVIDAQAKIWQDTFPLNYRSNYHVFASEKLAKSAIAMARISQLLAHDERYGGAITDEEWTGYNRKHVIERIGGQIELSNTRCSYTFLAFHTSEQRNLFSKENEQLIKDYLMIDMQ